MIKNSCDHFLAERLIGIQVDGDMEIQVYSVENRIEQVVVNFLNNAIKYAPHGKLIGIKCSAENSFVKISVSNQGLVWSKINSIIVLTVTTDR